LTRPSSLQALKPQHVAHRIEAGGAAAGPQGGVHGAAGEDAPIGRAVNQLQSLALARQHHRVVAGDVAAALTLPLQVILPEIEGHGHGARLAFLLGPAALFPMHRQR